MGVMEYRSAGVLESVELDLFFMNCRRRNNKIGHHPFLISNAPIFHHSMGFWERQDHPFGEIKAWLSGPGFFNF
jgi:hypothetical protein